MNKLILLSILTTLSTNAIASENNSAIKKTHFISVGIGTNKNKVDSDIGHGTFDNDSAYSLEYGQLFMTHNPNFLAGWSVEVSRSETSISYEEYNSDWGIYENYKDTLRIPLLGANFYAMYNSKYFNIYGAVGYIANFGFGPKWKETNLDTGESIVAKDKDVNIGFQIKLGAQTKVYKNLSVGLEYKHSDITLEFDETNDGTYYFIGGIKAKNKINSFMLKTSFNF